MSHFSSPLRYPGGKGALTGYIQQLMIRNNLVGGEYIEIYAGGAAIAWNLLFTNFVRRVHVNDLDPALFSFWYAVLFETEELCRKIRDTPITVEEWKQQKSVYSQSQGSPNLDLGFSAFFLNRTNRSGILTGGVIGGKAQTGEWKINARFNKADLIRRIYRIAEFAARISIYNFDAKEFLETKLQNIHGTSLIYLDPPYYVKGQGLYKNYYEHADHVEIAKLLYALKKPWLLSYDNHLEICSLYSKFSKIEYGLVYTAQKKYSGSEVIFFSDSLTPVESNGVAEFKVSRNLLGNQI